MQSGVAATLLVQQEWEDVVREKSTNAKEGLWGKKNSKFQIYLAPNRLHHQEIKVLEKSVLIKSVQ